MIVPSPPPRAGGHPFFKAQEKAWDLQNGTKMDDSEKFPGFDKDGVYRGKNGHPVWNLTFKDEAGHKRYAYNIESPMPPISIYGCEVIEATLVEDLTTRDNCGITNEKR